MRIKYFLKGSVIALIILYLFYPLLFDFVEHGSIKSINPFIIKEMLINLLMLVCFGLNYYYWIDTFFLQYKYKIYFTIIILTLPLILYIPNLIFNKPKPTHFHGVELILEDFNNTHIKNKFKHKPENFLLHEMEEHAVIYFIVILLLIFLKVRKKFYNIELLQKKSEIALLNAQVSPHFLFNALNTVYFLAIEEGANNTGSAVLELSNLLRYSDSDINVNTNSLKDELKIIKEFINFQKLRFGNNLILKVSIPEIIGEVMIGKLLILPFVENAFKFGINPSTINKIEITASITGNTLYFMCKNNKSNMSKSSKNSGVGITNTQKRLELLYPQHHNLEFIEDNKTFEIKLKINL